MSSPYFLAFQFQPQGIRVDGAAYPVVKMAWATGTTLGEFLESNLKNSAALGRLAAALVQLSAYLQGAGIAHGDLQSGNLMVSRDGSSVQLIDYDGMFVDEIRGLGSAELGHVNFQHPQRKSLNPFDASLDRFSLISLSLAIRALQADWSLWDKTSSEADAIIFRANDFLDPSSSIAFSLIAKNPSLSSEAKNFAAICKSPMAKTPDLADFVAGRNIPSLSIVIGGQKASLGTTPAPSQQGYVGAYPVLSADDYAVCLRAVGDKVEVIGRIVEVKMDKTRGGKPYVFINFGPWKGNIFKVSIWSDGFSHLKAQPTSAWVGQWASVVGLMEPPYTNKKFGYSHLSITAGAAGTVTLISQLEAQRRLAGAGKSAAAFSAAASANQQTLNKLKGVPGVGASATSAPTRLPQPSQPAAANANAQVLQQLRSKTSTATSSGSQRATTVLTNPRAPASTNSRGPSPHTYRAPPPTLPSSGQTGVVWKVLKWLFG